MIRLWKWIFTNKLTVFTLIFIFLLGLFLRLYRLPEMTGWYDSARDYMVGRKLADKFSKGGFELKMVAPLASGSEGALKNSPIYYYLVALLVQIFSDPMVVASFVAFLSSLVILVNYLIGLRFGGTRAGLVAAFFSAISYVLINQSITLTQPDFLPLLVSCLTLAMLLAHEQKSVYWALTSVIIFWFFFHLHYSILLFTPAIFWSFWQIGRRVAQTKHGLIKSGYLIGMFLFLGLIWYSLTNSLTNFDLVAFLLKSFAKGAGGGFLVTLQKVFASFSTFLTLYFWHLHLAAVGMIFVGVSLIYAVDLISKKKMSKDRFLETFLVLIFISTGLLTFFNRPIDESYFVILFTVMPLILTVVFELIARWKSHLGLFFLVTMSVWLNFGNERLGRQNISSFMSSQLVSEQILIDLKNKNIQDLGQIFIASRSPELPVYDWTSSKYWYFLEKETGQFNTSLSDKFNNLTWNSFNPQFFYLVCEGYDLNQIKQVETECLDPYLAKLVFIFESKIEEIVIDRIGVKIFVLQVKPNLSISYLWPFRVVGVKEAD